MPVYEYRCHDCGHLTEALRSMSEADTSLVCESCQSKDTARVQSVFSASAGALAPMAPCGMPGMGGGCCGGGACGRQH